MNRNDRFPPSFPKPITKIPCLLNPTHIRQESDKLACPQPQYPWESLPLSRPSGPVPPRIESRQPCRAKPSLATDLVQAHQGSRRRARQSRWHLQILVALRVGEIHLRRAGEGYVSPLRESVIVEARSCHLGGRLVAFLDAKLRHQ